MNTKLKLALLRQSSQRGAILLIIIGIGLIMTLAGTTMIIRSSSEQLTASAQKGTAQSLSAAEAGVTQVMQFINLVRVVADQDLTNWQSEYDSANLVCGGSTNVTAYANKDWVAINSGKDRFKILDYDYTADDSTNINSPGTGVLKVEGQANFNQNTSTSVVEVSIPVSPQLTGVPGLYATEVDLNNNKVGGDVLLYNCNISNVDTSNIEDGGEVTNNSFAKFPDLPEIPPSVTPVDLGTITSIPANPSGDNILTLPDTTNHTAAQDSDGRYHYVVDSIDLSGGNQTIEITPGEQVTFYLKGNIELSGNATILHDCDLGAGCEPTNFQIFGGDGGTNTYASSTTTLICLSGNSTVDAFIFAPAAKVAVGGSGGGDGITGSVWADRWNTGSPSSCGSNTGQRVVTQAADWNDLPLPAPRTISAPSSWERKTASTP